MNNILSDTVIEKINNYDLTQLKVLFDDVSNDTQLAKRQSQQLGVNNRKKLIPATSYKPFGRDSDGVPVYARPESRGYTGDYEMNMKSHKDFVSMIATSKTGYMSGIEIVSENVSAKQIVDDFMKINSFDATHNELVDSTCSYAVKALRLYTDDQKGVTYSEVEPWTYAPFYDKTGKLVGVMQWEATTKEIQDNYAVGKYRVSYLNENEDMYFFTDKQNQVLLPNTQDYPEMVVNNIDIGSGKKPHTFNGVPFVEFFNNSDRLGDVEKTLDSQDAYDELVSKANTGYGAFSDVLLVDKTKPEDGGGTISKEDFKEMSKVLKDHGIISGDWMWLSKNYEGYQNLLSHLTLLERNIFEGSNSYNPNSLGGEGVNATAYQIRQKLKPLIDSAVKTEMEFRKSYMELFRLVLTVGLSNNNNTDYLDLDILFQHTVPEDEIATLKQLKEAGVPVPAELAFTKAGYKWSEVEPMLKEEEARIMSEFNENTTREDIEQIR